MPVQAMSRHPTVIAYDICRIHHRLTTAADESKALLLLLWALSEAVDVDSLLPGTVDLLVLILEKTQSV